MEDIYIWKMNDQEFAFDIEDADAAERYEKGLEFFKTLTLPNPKTEGLSAYIRAQREAYRRFFDIVIGDGTSDKLFGKAPDNLRIYTRTYKDFLSFVTAQSIAAEEEFRMLKQKYLPDQNQ